MLSTRITFASCFIIQKVHLPLHDKHLNDNELLLNKLNTLVKYDNDVFDFENSSYSF